MSVFGDGISIKDDLSVLVRYKNRATMTYYLTAYSPWEGYRVAFNGSKGRLEYEVHEASYVSGAGDDTHRPDVRDAKELEIEEPARILVRPLWGKPMEIEVQSGEGGHGGATSACSRTCFWARKTIRWAAPPITSMARSPF